MMTLSTKAIAVVMVPLTEVMAAVVMTLLTKAMAVLTAKTVSVLIARTVAIIRLLRYWLLPQESRTMTPRRSISSI